MFRDIPAKVAVVSALSQPPVLRLLRERGGHAACYDGRTAGAENYVAEIVVSGELAGQIPGTKGRSSPRSP